MFVLGIVVTIIAGFIGLSHDPSEVAEGDQPNGEAVESAAPDALVQQSCIGCHGTDLQGGMGGAAPSLVNMDISKEEIIEVLTNGRGAMPPGVAAGNEEAVAEYLLSIQQ